MTLEERMQELRELSKKAATARADREYLEEFKKSRLAILMKEAEQRGFTTAASQEREARASNDYEICLAGLRSAVEMSEQLEWELRIAMKGADLWQTAQMVEMSERKAYKA